MIKRIALLLLLALLLIGCQTQHPLDTHSPEETLAATQPPEQGIYLPGNDVELLTDGAIRAYAPETGTVLGLRIFQGRLLVICQQESRVLLSLYEGDALTKVSETGTNSFQLDGPAVQISKDTISYYDEVNREVVLLGSDLLERERVLMPQDAVGEPAVASDFSMIYYSTGTQIRAMDIQTGVVRLLREMAQQQVMLQKLCFDNSTLVCTVLEPEGSQTAFFSAQTGQTIHMDQELLSISPAGDWYIAQRRCFRDTEHIFGTVDNQPRMLHLPDPATSYVNLTQSAAMLTLSQGRLLELYNLNSGQRAAQLTLPESYTLLDAAADPGGRWVWLALQDAQEHTAIYRWDLLQCQAYSTESYTSAWYTPENPDEDGLAECQQIADRLSQTYGVDISFAPDRVIPSNNYQFVTEHRVQPLKQGLAALETALSRFPEGFFTTLAQVTKDGVLHICLLQDIQTRTGQNAAMGLRYWVDGKEYVAIVLYEDTEQGLYHEFYHALDSFLLANSGVLDTWNNLNPKDFNYDENVTDYLNRPETPLLSGSTRAFIDSYSMSYPKEDRARVFEYAMMPGNEEYFTSKTMQAKLKLLCKAIRDAYDWKGDPRELPWEQYLN